ncbi:MAG: rhomboid family intramembrane serine protease [Nitriliruptorales bacterium]|nr:rhomboid family intramembrane serine protease [Nitriliruptorales bacterium]
MSGDRGGPPEQAPPTGRSGREAEPIVTYWLLGAIVLAFLLSQAAPDLADRGVLFGPAVAAGEWGRIVTSGFLHAGLLHIGFNGYLLYLLGRMLEPGIGSTRFTAIYLGGLFGGSAGALLLSWATPTLGASGAVFGLMGGAMVGLRRRGIDPWRSSIGTLVLLNLAFTFLVPGISIGGHVGGLVGGAATAAPLFAAERGEARRVGAAAGYAVVAGLGAAAVLLGEWAPLA